MARLPLERILDANGDPVSGGRAYIFEAGTTNAVTPYSDTGLTTAHGAFVSSNSAGEWPDAYVSAGSYKIRYTDADVAVLYEQDNVFVYSSEVGTYRASSYGADPSASNAENAAAIQAAIDAAHAAGGGTVYLDADLTITSNEDQTSILNIISGPSLVTTTLGLRACLYLKNNVTLDLQGHKLTAGITRACIGIVDGRNIALRNGTLEGAGWDQGGAASVEFFVTSVGNRHENVTIENIRAIEWGGYGMGLQYGDRDGVTFRNIYIDSVGADGFDLKPRLGATNKGVGVSLSGLTIRRFARDAIGSTGLDIRGAISISDVQVYDFADTALGAVTGIRINTSLTDANGNRRQGGEFSTLQGFVVDSGDANTSKDVKGLHILSGYGATISSGVVRNCPGGVLLNSASSGIGKASDYASLNNVMIEGCRDYGVRVVSDYVRLNGVRVLGQLELFNQKSANLSAGQTTFNTAQDFDTGTVIVRKNGAVLSAPGDYSVTDANTIELASGVVISDTIEIVCPTTVGLDIDGEYSLIDGCYTKDCTLGISRQPSTIVGQNWFEGENKALTVGGTSIVELRPITSNENESIALFSRGTGNVQLRTDAGRVFVASYAENAVNWVGVKQSATGDPVEVGAGGSDATIDLKLAPGGVNGRVQINTATSAISGETLSRYIEIKDSGGTVRKVAIVE